MRRCGRHRAVPGFRARRRRSSLERFVRGRQRSESRSRDSGPLLAHDAREPRPGARRAARAETPETAEHALPPARVERGPSPARVVRDRTAAARRTLKTLPTSPPADSTTSCRPRPPGSGTSLRDAARSANCADSISSRSAAGSPGSTRPDRPGRQVPEPGPGRMVGTTATRLVMSPGSAKNSASAACARTRSARATDTSPSRSMASRSARIRS